MGSSAIGQRNTPPARTITQRLSNRQNSGRSRIDLEMHLVRAVEVVATPPDRFPISARQSRTNRRLLVLSVGVPDPQRVRNGI